MGVLAAPASISGWGICLTVREEALLLERNLSCRSFFRGVVSGNALAGGLPPCSQTCLQKTYPTSAEILSCLQRKTAPGGF